jgi:hypothetical protein
LDPLSASHIRRDSHDLRKRLPMPWMRDALARPDI